MSSRTVEQVDEWEPVSFGGGYDGLRTLADRAFSGAVVAGPAHLFMLNGTVVGVLGGTIEGFEDADGTAREAPHEALPLLAVMQEQDTEPQGQYYTEDTPISEVDSTLSSGKFTGYVELSENVLSGDYYTVYHQGRSMSVAWVGSSGQLITDDEAFRQADDEVGIYDVVPADIEPIEIPGAGASAATTTTDRPADTGQSGTGDRSDDERSETGTERSGTTSAKEWAYSTDEPPEADSESTAEEREPARSGTESSAEDTPTERRPESTADADDPVPGGPPGSKSLGGRDTASGRQSPGERDAEPDRASGAPEGTEPGDEPTPARERDGDTATTEPGDDDRTTAREPEQSSETSTPPSEAEQTEAARGSDVSRPSPSEPDTPQTEPPEPDTPQTETSNSPEAETPQAEPSQPSGPSDTTDQPSSDPEPAAVAAASATESADDSTDVADLETRSIPSLDPERSSRPGDDQPADTPEADTATGAETSQPTAAVDPGDTDPQESTGPSDQTEQATPSEPETTPEPETDARVAELERRLDDRNAEIDELEAELARLEDETETLRSERDGLEAELREANDEIARLEDRVGRLREQLPDQPEGDDAGPRLSPAEALGGTNLFVRYRSKSEATLADAREGDADPADVESNLRIQYHTQFASEDATVDGRPFHDFLTGRLEYRFVDYLVRRLLYAIRETGHSADLEVLYEAIPEIDRIELDGQVSLTYVEDGEEHRQQARYDVVARDRMGNPLIVANINDRREPASRDQMSELLTTTERLGNTSGSLAAAFLVTESFFEPAALEAADEATASGLLSRSKRASFVNLSRSDGYHLCLLEARDGEFNMAVPEL